MGRTDTASLVIRASRAAVYAAFVDRDALLAWLPAAGMHGSFEHFDPRPGGSTG
ncbi:MAG: SRPBCC domain-containing protein [Ilumatobacteraceae bacterium]